ncbi:GspH/FimT family pseudopilin [Geoalkalibacter halelectricus]|uniref:GspH/FimT family pseudopilin n=1 Tax=Geoalkalibacter halelectricus TaxID=2847045 RepID=UPI003D1B257D
MLSSSRGFALIEALVVLGLIGILLTIGYPYYQVFMQNASYRSAAREVASVMRQARAEAATRNREHQVKFDFKENSYLLRRGNRVRGSDDWARVTGERTLSSLVDLRAWDGNQCVASPDSLILNFFPDGTTNHTAGICILNRAGERRFLVQLTSRATGHVTVGR